MRRFAPALALVVAGCIPSAARTNARLEPGFSLQGVAGAQSLLAGVDDEGQRTEPTNTVHLELAAQYAGPLGVDSGNFAVQVKVPAIYIYSSLDLYYELPLGSDDFYAGIGGEVGIVGGGYVVLTKYLSPTFYLTFTPRVLSVGVNPQLALGFSGDADVSLIASYLRFLGDGIDIDIDLFSDNDDEDRRTDAFLLALSFRP